MNNLKKYLAWTLVLIMCSTFSAKQVQASGSLTGQIQFHNIKKGTHIDAPADNNKVVLSNGTISKTFSYCITPDASTSDTNGHIVIKILGLFGTRELYKWYLPVDGNFYTKSINLLAGTYYIAYENVTVDILAATFGFYD